MKKIKGLLEKYPLFLLTTPFFILLHVAKDYGHLINYKFVTREIIIIFVAPFIIYLAVRVVLKSASKANLMAFVILFFFYFTGEIKDGLRQEWPGSIVQRYSFLLPFILIIIICSYIIIKRKKVKPNVLLFINSAMILFAVVDGSRIIFTRITKNRPVNEKKSAPALCEECKKPDIYYIVFDSYTSSNLLKTEFGFDNSSQDNYLTEKGFRIINNSRSNYNLTPFSISSIFNMEYLANTDTSNILRLKEYLPAVEKVYYTTLFPVMKKQGYRIYNHSSFDFNESPSSVPGFDIWKIKTIYQQFNIIKKIHNEIGWQLPFWKKITADNSLTYIKNRDTHDSIALIHLTKTIEDASTGPKLVYTHFFLPHSPYSRDSAGEKIKVAYNLSPEEDKQAYVQQLIYANKIMKKIVETIQEKSNGKAVIIIQSDHGYRFFDDSKKQLEFPNFNAIYFPDQNYNQLYDSMSSVNTFRAVFNTFFRQNYPMLPTKSYFLKYK